MDDRRVHDAQIQELHTDVRDLREAVQTIDRHLNNGITDRGIATEKMVKTLHDEHAGLKNLLQAHIKEETSIHNDMQESVTELTECLRDAKIWRTRILVGLVVMLSSMFGWTVLHSQDIALIVEHITKITG